MSRLRFSLVVSAVLVAAPQSGMAGGFHDYDSKRVRGATTGSFSQFDYLMDVDGSRLFNVNIEGTFSLRVGGAERNGTFVFPHLLQIPLSEEGLGTVAGVAFWTFDGGLICIGDLGGPIGPDGGRTSGRLRCSDGSSLVLFIKDDVVTPGVQVTTKVRGRFVYAARDD